MVDKLLLEQARTGDEAAFRALFDKYWPDLFQLARKRLRRQDEAADMVQEVFLALWKNIDRIETEDSLAPFLFITLRNRIFNYYEKQSVRLKYLLRQPSEPVLSEEHIFSAIRNKELLHLLQAAIHGMPPRMQEIYRLSREQMMSSGEIAELLMISHQTVKNQLHRALERIRQTLQVKHLHKYTNLF
ncbi:MAG: RNA polymerase sigma factor [Chitinophaga sp.]